jgi:metal-sulfur cluster biosynthetic enzyme
MSDDPKSQALNPHTGAANPADPANPNAVGAPAAEAPPAAKPSGPPQWSSMPSPQELAVRGALETVMDPEIGLSVIDLGLIREIHFSPGKTLVRMMLTTPFCPYAPQMMADVKQATEGAVPQPCEVDMLPDAWSPEMMPDPGLLGFSY